MRWAVANRTTETATPAAAIAATSVCGASPNVRRSTCSYDTGPGRGSVAGRSKACVSGSAIVLVQSARATDVILDRVQEGLVGRELCERSLRLRVEVTIVLQLVQERREPSRL